MADRKRPFDAASCKRGSDRTRHFSHLTPLSVYARSVFSKATNSCPVSPSWSPDSPSWNLKVEFTNRRASVGRKRRLDDLCLVDDYDTPAKKPCLGSGSSPDSPCDLHFRQVKLVSLRSSSAILDGIRRIDKTLSDQEPLGLGWIHCTDRNKGRSSKPLPAVHSSSPMILPNKGSVDGVAFDYEVDAIMCLSPIGGPDGQVDFVQSYRTYEEQLLAEVTCNPGQNRAKAESTLGKVSQTESDEGYVTKSFDKTDSKDTSGSEVTKSGQLSVLKSYQITIPTWSNDKAPPGSIPVVSTPLDKSKPSPLLCPNLNVDKDDWSSPRIVSEMANTSFSISLTADENLDADETQALPLLNLMESKQGNVVCEGASVSSVCPNQEKSFANQVKEDQNVPSVGQQPAAYKGTVMIGEKTDEEDCFEITLLPLQVQVKSKVALANTQEPEANKAPAHQPPEKKAASEGHRNVIPSPALLDREKEWEKEKRAYVNSVTRHISENGEAGAMTELLHLMSAVANQGRGSHGRRWQHPSDLTRRNYRLPNSSRLLSLDEWQNKNYHYRRRFANVPPVFQRSPVL